MDANRETVPVMMAGREVAVIRPSENQLVGLAMWSEADLPYATKLKSLSKLFTALIPVEDDRAWFFEQLLMGDYTLGEMTKTIQQIATAGKDQPKPPAPRAAVKKTAARRR